MKESILYYSVRALGFMIRRLPGSWALWIGKRIGMCGYYFDIKHKSRAYANLKIAFSQTKSPDEIKQITKQLFKSYGQNLIELFRMPLVTPEKFDRFVTVEGKEHVTDALKLGKGVIMVAMHFGSWELASLSCVHLYPYKVLVKTQKRYSRLDDLLNSYRAGGESAVLTRGEGTRDVMRCLNNNQVIGMVVDQGGRDGVLVPFFGRNAKMSVGALRIGLKLDVPICYSVIFRESGSRHRMIVHKPFVLERTGDTEKDLVANLTKVTRIMEEYIRKYPHEYMWFYKIWKYSDEADITILSDGRAGHVRQSQAVARLTESALGERNIRAATQVIPIVFKSKVIGRLFSVVSALLPPFFYQGRLEHLKYFLTEDSFRRVTAMKSNFIISCGSSIAGVNNLLSRDANAKSMVVLKPGLLRHSRFDLVVLPRHDDPKRKTGKTCFAITHAAPNLVTPEYLERQSEALLNRYSHLKDNHKRKIGLLIGGDAKTVFLPERQIRMLVRQIKGVLEETNMDVLITTSRRTPARIEQLLVKEFRKYSNCPLLILANQENVDEAVGGILGLSDIVIVSGDSLSMVSEAASSGKNTIVFTPQTRAKVLKGRNKSLLFTEGLSAQGFILSASTQQIGQAVYDVAKGKIQTKQVNDRPTILEAVRSVI